MPFKIQRFGLPYNPQKEKSKRNKITKHIIIFLCVFVIVAAIVALGFALCMRNYIACLSINNTIDSIWIGSLASYWGGIIGGVFSGVFAFLGVFYTIKYYKESDEQKERSAIQPFLLVTVGSDKDTKKGFTLGDKSDEETGEKIKVTKKNIGNGFANTLVIHTGFNLRGLSYNKVISVGDSDGLFFMVAPKDLKKEIDFGIQYIDAMRNEYVQEYKMSEEHGYIDIECGYPAFLEQR